MSDIPTETPEPTQDAPQASTNFSDYVNGTELKEGWQASLGEEFANNKTLAKFKDMRGFAKSAINLEKMIGSNTVKVPGENAGPDDWKEFYKVAGLPDDPDGYGKDPVEGLPENIGWDENRATEFNKFAHEINLTKKQRDALIKYDAERGAASLDSTKTLQSLNGSTGELITSLLNGDESYQQHVEQTKAQLAKELGENGLALAARAANALGMGDLINDPVLGNHPEFLRGMKQASKLFGESNLPKTDGEMGLSDIDEQIKAYFKPGTQENADYMSSNKQVQNDASKKLTKLYMLKQSKKS